MREMESGSIAGIPLVLAHARNGEAVAFVATIDGDGLLESVDDCRQFARRFKDKLDKSKISGKDSG